MSEMQIIFKFEEILILNDNKNVCNRDGWAIAGKRMRFHGSGNNSYHVQ